MIKRVSYVVQDFGMHERFDHGQNFVEEIDDVEHVDSAEFSWNSFLKICKELFDRAQIYTCQMH